jgi:hypothetical protein
MTAIPTDLYRTILLAAASGAPLVDALPGSDAYRQYHRRRMLDDLQATDTTHALAIALVRGLLTVEDLRRAGVW